MNSPRYVHVVDGRQHTECQRVRSTEDDQLDAARGRPSAATSKLGSSTAVHINGFRVGAYRGISRAELVADVEAAKRGLAGEVVVALRRGRRGRVDDSLVIYRLECFRTG